MANRLSGETSPYLLQHAANPVDWHPWGAAALALAREQDKPILLSIGYSACHWCHVMAHESFEDVEVAAVMNRLFVNIKVDREERPDLDQIYQSAHQMLAGRPGGWPLTMFLMPDGGPFYGGTYFPKVSRYGLPGFVDVCERVADVWNTRRNDVEAQRRELVDALARRAPVTAGPAALDTRPIAAARDMLLKNFDADFGGFGGAPKFPHPTDLAFLLRSDDADARNAALVTLARMAEGGIYDHLGGGFCRYSTDERWEIPHFEKMLYDNGPLLGLYADAWRLTGDPLFERVVEETVAWVQREMTTTEGAFYSALDADSEGEEGKFYVWSREQVAALLTPDELALVTRRYGLDGAPNFENAHWHLKIVRPLSGPTPVLSAAETTLLDGARAKLLAVREKRIRPGLDDKVLTSWNAQMIEGLAHAARIFVKPDWLVAAQRALAFIRGTLWRDGAPPQGRPKAGPANGPEPLSGEHSFSTDGFAQPSGFVGAELCSAKPRLCPPPGWGPGGGGRLLATTKDGKAHLNAYLDDYAYLLSALLELLQTEFRSADLDFARELADALLERFEDADAGGFYFTSHDHEALIHRPKSGFDSAMPSGNGVAAVSLQRLGHLLGESRYLDAARRTVDCFWPQMQRQAGGFSVLLQALDEALTPPSIVILRGPETEVHDWQRRLAGVPVANSLVLGVPNAAGDLPDALTKPESQSVNAWVCRGVTCMAPIANFAEALHVLQAG
jgi:hypothetical protein